MSAIDLAFLLTLFLGLLVFAGWVARVWPRTWPGGEYVDEYTGPERRHG